MTLSAEMSRVVRRLSTDWNFVEDFLSSPRTSLEAFGLTEEERRCLATRSVEGLMALGLDASSAVQAMSGAHSPTCTAIN